MFQVNGVSMINVEHQVAVNALRTDATRFKLLLCREVPVVTQPLPPPSSNVAAGLVAVPQIQQPPPYLVDPQRARNLPPSLLSTTSLGRSIPNATIPLPQVAPTAMQVSGFVVFISYTFFISV